MATVLFDPHPKQMEFIESVISNENNFVLFGGAIRGGKTYAMLGLFILLARLYPGSRFAIIRKDLPRIKRNVLPQFFQVCPDRFILKHPSQANEWTATFTNGSELMFFAENADKDPNLDRFKGLEVDGIGIEEMDITEDGFNKCFERVGTWKMGKRKEQRENGQQTPPQFVCGTCNPSHGWVKRRIYDNWKSNKLPHGWKYIPSKVFDNPYIEPEWIEDKRKSMTPLNYKQFVEGDWEVNLNEHPFFYEYKRERNISSEPFQLNASEPVWLSFDFNISPTTCVVGQKIHGKGLMIYKVHQADGGTRELCKVLKQYENYMLKVTGDRSGNSGNTAAGVLAGGQLNTDYHIIKEELNLSPYQLIDTQTANKMHVHSRELCNMVFFRVPLLINPDGCDSLINDLETGQPRPDGRLLKDRENHKQDSGDAFRYLINAWFLRGAVDVNDFLKFF